MSPVRPKIPAGSTTVGHTYIEAPAPNGTSDNSAALTAAWGTGGALVLRPGTYNMAAKITPPASGCKLIGMGSGGGSELKKTADTILLDYSGSGTSSDGSTHCAFTQAEDITLNGGNNASWTQPLFRAFYANNLKLNRLYLKQNYGPGMSGVEWWDSQINDCAMANVGGTSGSGANAALLLQRQAATSGFGVSTGQTVNMLTFKSLRIETFRDGAVNIDQGAGATGENQTIKFIGNCKFETTQFRGKAFRANAVRGLTVQGAYCWVGGFDSGYSSPDDFFYFTSVLDSTIDDILIGEGGSYLYNFFRFDGGNYYTTFSNIRARDYGAITGAIARFRNGGNNVAVRNVAWSLNTSTRPVFDGCPDIPWELSGSGVAPGTATILTGGGGYSGALAGAIGSTFRSTDGGAGTTLFVKESGAGTTTGWVAK